MVGLTRVVRSRFPADFELQTLVKLLVAACRYKGQSSSREINILASAQTEVSSYKQLHLVV
jgi:hypothetical protein